MEYRFLFISEFTDRCVDNVANTGPFDLTGHPALSINAGFVEGLPVGMMIVGRHFDDVTVLKVGHVFEQIRDAWRRTFMETSFANSPFTALITMRYLWSSHHDAVYAIFADIMLTWYVYMISAKIE